MTQDTKLKEFSIVKASRYFKVCPKTPRAIRMCRIFQERYIHRGFSTNKDQGEEAEAKLYAVATAEENEFRYHRNTLGRFLVHIKEFLYKEEDFEVSDKPLPVCEKRKIKVKDQWKVLDYQEPIVEYLAAPFPVNKFIGIQTGKGKTFCSLYGVAQLGYRTIIIIEGGMLKKWGSDIMKVLDIPAKRTLSVRGGAQLKGLIGLAGTKEFEKIDIIIMSSGTFQDWVTMHETLSVDGKSDVGYGIHPEEFYEKLQIGHRLIDEVHKKFHFNYKQDLYANTHCCTSLSATLFSYDKVLESFYEVAYPKDERYNGGAIDKYAKSYAVNWSLQRNRKIKTKEYGRSTYSHTAFEGSILKNTQFCNNYFEMIAETIDIGYVKNYKEGNKVAVYVATTNMATELVRFLRRRFPDRTVERYVGSLNDPYANLLDPDIRVTTLGSGGTGHDIPGLTDTILTVAIMSLQANIQVFGRLRFIPNQDTRFYYFNCTDVEQHMKYHDLKTKLMEERAKSFETLRYNNEI